MVSAEQVKTFFQEFIGDEGLSKDRSLVVWWGPGQGNAKTINLDAAVRACVEPQGPGNVYWGVCRVDASDLSSAQRGSLEHITEVPALWLDIDYEDGAAHSKGGLPPSMDAALQVVELMPVPPTAVVHSGHGLHAYWLFNEPEPTTDEAARDQMELLSFRWNQHARAVCERLGWAIDSTYDLTRVLRVPGTMNRKPDKEPVPCVLLDEHTDWRRRYEPDDLAQYVIDVKDQRGRAAKSQVCTEDLPPTIEIGYTLVCDKLMPFVEALCDSHSGFKRIWERKPKPSDPSPPSGASEWDMSFAMSVISHLRGSSTLSAWTDLELLQLLSLYRQNQPNDDKPHKATETRYLAMTLANAKLRVFESDDAAEAHVKAEARRIENERDMDQAVRAVRSAENEIQAAVQSGDLDAARDIQEQRQSDIDAAQRRAIDIILDSLLSNREESDLLRIEMVRTSGASNDLLALHWRVGSNTEVIARSIGQLPSRRTEVATVLHSRGIPIRDDYISPPRPWPAGLMKWSEVITALLKVACSPPIGEVGAQDEDDRVVEEMLAQYFRHTCSAGQRHSMTLQANEEGGATGAVDLIGGAGNCDESRRRTLSAAFQQDRPAYFFSDGPAASGVYHGVSISTAAATGTMQDTQEREDNFTRFPSATMRAKAIRQWMVRHGWLSEGDRGLTNLSASVGGRSIRKKRLVLPPDAVERICARDEAGELADVLLPGDRDMASELLDRARSNRSES